MRDAAFDAPAAVTRAAIGIGGNTGDVERAVVLALHRLGRLGRLAAVSPLYRSKAWGVTEQPDFLNAVALLDTRLSARDLLRELKGIERDLGRVPTFRWGPRAIDLDILTFGGRTIREPGLEIPHPRMRERAFVLLPLADVDPAFEAVAAALDAAARDGVQRIRPPAARNELTVDWDQTLDRVRSAAEFCASSGLSRFRIDEADLEIEVKRTVRVQPAPVAAPAAGQTSSNSAAAASNGAPHEAPPAKVLKAEFVGILRLARPAVIEGTELSQDREVAYVESLGIRNPIRSGGPGRVAAIFVADGQAVEYGQPLFAIEPKSA